MRQNEMRKKDCVSSRGNHFEARHESRRRRRHKGCARQVQELVQGLLFSLSPLSLSVFASSVCFVPSS